MATRGHLGGLAWSAPQAIRVLDAAGCDVVLVETVGVGQSEADVALVGDTILLAVQPASGDALQFIKAGVMELPDVVAVTKADLGAPARRARDDLEGALALASAGDGDWDVPVTLVSSETGEGLDVLLQHLDSHSAFQRQGVRRDSRRRRQSQARLEASLRGRFGTEGVIAARPLLASIEGGPFAREASVARLLSARLAAEPAVPR
jgi:LAO/AO transport system kinase